MAMKPALVLRPLLEVIAERERLLAEMRRDVTVELIREWRRQYGYQMDRWQDDGGP